MAWSTREVAELAGTTLRAVRYYHEIGLLELPERGVNGYKQYGVAHLVRLLRIRRLLDLGMSVQQVRALGDLADLPEAELRRLDDEVRADIERLERVHQELGRLLEESGDVDLPAPLAALATERELTDNDRKLLVVLSRVLEPAQLTAVADMVRWLPVTETSLAFDHLPADAPEEVRRDLAEAMLPENLEVRERFPDLPGVGIDDPDSPARRAVQLALVEIYNPAQLDVLQRVARLRSARRTGSA